MSSTIQGRRTACGTRNIHAIYISQHPRSRSNGTTDAETGAKILERRRRQPFGHDVRKLLGSRDMENPDVSKSHLFPNRIDIEHNMFGAAVMNWVGGEVHSGDVVAVDNGGLGDRTRELKKKLTKPGALCNNISHCSILGFSTGARNSGLPLRRPRDQRWSKINRIA